jgi:hypothetical protein
MEEPYPSSAFALLLRTLSAKIEHAVMRTKEGTFHGSRGQCVLNYN